MANVPDDRRERIASDPFCETLGIELTVLESGHARTELRIRDELLNFHGTPHGGLVYSLADAAFAAASNSDGETALALETNISYLAAAAVGDTLVAIAEREDETRRTGTYRVDVGVEKDGSDGNEGERHGNGGRRRTCGSRDLPWPSVQTLIVSRTAAPDNSSMDRAYWKIHLNSHHPAKNTIESTFCSKIVGCDPIRNVHLTKMKI